MTSEDIEPLKTAIAQTFAREQVRAAYPNIVSESVKIEHDPRLASIVDICDALSNHGYDANVSTNGAELNLYLPHQEYDSKNDATDGEDLSLLSVHANVWLSGMFWFLSMFSYLDGR